MKLLLLLMLIIHHILVGVDVVICAVLLLATLMRIVGSRWTLIGEATTLVNIVVLVH